ncbi:hypothetical protein NXY00_21665 [Bacteroides sp. BFG-551]|nr:hypothetical protein [Bacteroides sp. BFG-551]
MKYAPIFFGLCILSFVCLCPSTAQNPVQITNYNYKNYKGGIQNWGITISPEQVLYAGNNNGLLKYNGNDWTLRNPENVEPYAQYTTSVTGFIRQATTILVTGNMPRTEESSILPSCL